MIGNFLTANHEIFCRGGIAQLPRLLKIFNKTFQIALSLEPNIMEGTFR